VSYPIHIVDVFTERALLGNQLAVVLDAGDIPPEVMQRVAREMNFSETTFVMAPSQPGHAARVASSLREQSCLSPGTRQSAQPG
jgi:trans-2,3-dihydro-3-hydroxyanthranilate isomerase